MMKSRGQIVDETLQALAAIFREAQKGALTQWLSLDLTMAQLKALLVISRSGSLAIGTLAAELGVGLPAASQIVERLVRDGFVERHDDPADRRKVLVHPTTEGRQAVARLREVGRERISEWMCQLGDDDLTALSDGVRALALLAAPSLVVAGEKSGESLATEKN